MSGTVGLKMYGLGLLAFIVLLTIAAGVSYSEAFAQKVTVSVKANRSGLIMEPGNDVKMRGVLVGTVSAVAATKDGAVLTVGLNPDKTKWIPVNVQARIEPTTVFGSKFVSLELPADPSSERIEEGDVIDNKDVVVEINTVFENLMRVLGVLEPAKVNATLGALATTLQGRGEQLGKSLAQLNSYLGRFNRLLPTLRQDLRKTARVAGLYGDVTPDVLRVLDNATETSQTLVDEHAELDRFLDDIVSASTKVEEVLTQNASDLATVLGLAVPTTSLLERYSPGLTCFIVGLDNARKLLEPVIGSYNASLNLHATFLSGVDPYRYPEDLPVVRASSGPQCHGLPLLEADQIPAPYIETDTGTGISPKEGNQYEPGEPPLVVQLFGPLPDTSAEAPR